MTTDESLRAIPREDLIEMLTCKAWASCDRPEFKAQGFSFDVEEGTAIRDINYRHEPLYVSAEDALIAHWRRHYENRGNIRL